jgi:phospholipid/cholesterol/gamma-HCH transport system permease protein
MSYRAERQQEALRLSLLGDWTIQQVGDIERSLKALTLDDVVIVHLDLSAIESLDLSGAWLIHDLRARLAVDRTVELASPEPPMLRLVAQTLRKEGSAQISIRRGSRSVVENLGRHASDRFSGWLDGLAFLGVTVLRFLGALKDPRVWRPISIARHVYDTGLTAIPIVALIAFLIAIIIAYMGAQQLQQFGADIFVVDLVTVGVLRELGVLLTAIIVAGRSGSAFAAEIGAMKLNQEIDALKATGVEPIEVLVLPRWIGLVIALPLLTVIADAVGVAGGALLCHWLLDMPFVQYFQRVDESIAAWTFWVGIIKAPVFAVLIAAAGTYRGMQVRGSSRELGRLTTVAVVQAIFMVILADALFAVLFMEIGI